MATKALTFPALLWVAAFVASVLPAFAQPEPMLTTILSSPAAQFTILGDPNHGNLDRKKFLASDEFIDSLVAAHVKKVFFEYTHELQPQMDNVARGYVTPEQFAVYLTETGMGFSGARGADGQYKAGVYLGMMIKKLADKGIRFFAYDYRGMTANSENAGKILDRVYGCYADETKSALMKSNTISAAFEAFRRYAEMRERFFDDRYMAQTIVAAAGTDRSVVLPGAGHVVNPTGLDLWLGRKTGKARVAILYVTGELDDYVKYMLMLARDTGIDLDRSPDVYYNLLEHTASPNPPDGDVKRLRNAKGRGWLGPTC